MRQNLRSAELRFSRRVAASFNPLPAANSRRPLCFQQLNEIPPPLVSSGLGSPAAVAEGGRHTPLNFL